MSTQSVTSVEATRPCESVVVRPVGPIDTVARRTPAQQALVVAAAVAVLTASLTISVLLVVLTVHGLALTISAGQVLASLV